MASHPEINLTGRDILYHDDHCLAVNKAAGWPVHATRDPNRPHLEGGVRALLNANAAMSTTSPYMTVVHRIDVWTSGVVLLATSREAARSLNALFERRQVTKRYQAVCAGGPDADSGELKHYLAKRREAGRDVMKSVRSGGKVALSRYRVLGRGGGLSLIEFELLTGRTHQLRVQAATEGWPILGDSTYGRGYQRMRHAKSAVSAQGGARRPGPLLHARSLNFVHPTTSRPVVVEAPPPDDFEAYASGLRPTGS